MERTSAFWDRARALATAQGLDDARVKKLKSAQILRSLAARSDFTDAAVQVAKLVTTTNNYFLQHRTDYIQPGRLPEAERDQIEVQLGAYMKNCNKSIARLQASASPRGTPAAAACQAAHQLGVALVLSERLQYLGEMFDRARSKRYQQANVQRQEAARQAQRLQAAQARMATLAPPGHKQSSFDASSASFNPHAPPQQQQQQQQALEVENRALFEELEAKAQGVNQAESTVRELALLNQLFSVQVLQQGEQIELLYRQAVEATKNVEGGNVQLQKAIRLNTSARWYIFVLFMVASLGLLFLDWFSS